MQADISSQPEAYQKTFSGLVNSVLLFVTRIVNYVGRFMSRGRNPFNFKRYIPYAIIAFFVVLTLYALVKVLKTSGSSTSRVQIQGAKATQDLEKEFSFPLKNLEGEEISKIKFVVERAELRDEIIVKGKRATSVKGRTFLIFNLKITNKHSQSIKMNTRDYLRLSVNGNTSEWLAPDIHNDPVEIQPISTKYTRVGFPINDSDDKLTLMIGEINGQKEEIVLSLK